MQVVSHSFGHGLVPRAPGPVAALCLRPALFYALANAVERLPPYSSIVVFNCINTCPGSPQHDIQISSLSKSLPPARSSYKCRALPCRKTRQAEWYLPPSSPPNPLVRPPAVDLLPERAVRRTWSLGRTPAVLYHPPTTFTRARAPSRIRRFRGTFHLSFSFPSVRAVVFAVSSSPFYSSFPPFPPADTSRSAPRRVAPSLQPPHLILPLSSAQDRVQRTRCRAYSLKRDLLYNGPSNSLHSHHATCQSDLPILQARFPPPPSCFHGIL
jgi:hypothetical protein